MYRHDYEMNIDAGEIMKAASIFKGMQDEVRKRISQAIKNSLEEGLEYMIPKIPVDTGDLRESAHVVFKEGSLEGELVVDSDHAIYVEFGTGIVGKNSPHPEKDSGWYDVNNHGEKGWVIILSSGEYRTTRGQIGKHFFYDTRLYVEERLNYWLDELFKDIWSDFI